MGGETVSEVREKTTVIHCWPPSSSRSCGGSRRFDQLLTLVSLRLHHSMFAEIPRTHNVAEIEPHRFRLDREGRTVRRARHFVYERPRVITPDSRLPLVPQASCTRLCPFRQRELRTANCPVATHCEYAL